MFGGTQGQAPQLLAVNASWGDDAPGHLLSPIGWLPARPQVVANRIRCFTSIHNNTFDKELLT